MALGYNRPEDQAAGGPHTPPVKILSGPVIIGSKVSRPLKIYLSILIEYNKVWLL
jgi:hypothetical protein